MRNAIVDPCNTLKQSLSRWQFRAHTWVCWNLRNTLYRITKHMSCCVYKKCVNPSLKIFPNDWCVLVRHCCFFFAGWLFNTLSRCYVLQVEFGYKNYFLNSERDRRGIKLPAAPQKNEGHYRSRSMFEKAAALPLLFLNLLRPPLVIEAYKSSLGTRTKIHWLYFEGD